MSRQTTIEAIRNNPEVSVLIVGAGVNGIGLFRDLALQGIDVLMVDQNDFCSGASAGSSHMVHGGLRYLENAEFRLVREALIERNLLLKNAPHYVKPLPTTVPIFRWFSGMLNAPLKFLGLLDRPSERGAIVIKLGLTFYDLLSMRHRSMPTHKFTLKKKALKLRPSLNPDIICTATYYDAFMPYPERICIEMILDTEMLSDQAYALNYMRMENAEGDTVTLRDQITDESLVVKPKIVVNAAGPWIDFTNQAMKRETQYIGGTKGAHLIIDHPELRAACMNHEMFFENKDGRICLFLPLLDKVMVGTTDIPVDNPDDVEVTDEEIDYILETVKIVFPAIKLDRSHIVFHFTGVRPLPYSDASFTGQISRDHSTEIEEPGNGLNFPIYSMVSGKWTTFRAFSEQVTDKILKYLIKSRQASTEQMAIGGGKGYPTNEIDQKQWIAAMQKRTELPQEHLQVLFERYGTRAEEIADFIIAGPDEALQSQPDYSRREILFLATYEKLIHLDDLLLRRSLLAMGGFVTRNLLDEVGPIVGEGLCWSDEQIQQEIDRTATILTTEHGVSLS